MFSLHVSMKEHASVFLKAYAHAAIAVAVVPQYTHLVALSAFSCMPGVHEKSMLVNVQRGRTLAQAAAEA